MRRLACVTGAALLLAAPASAAVITRHATTASYKLTLSVGPKEAMYTAEELKTMGAANRHLEVHVASRATGKVVANAAPSISLTDTSAMGGMAASEKVNAMAMEGIGEGVADLHYGDNVKLTAGHVYKVVVTVKGEKANFSFKA
jgi:hypothetical protein